jgi:hypothetical protein
LSHVGGLTQLQCFAYWTSCAIATYEVAASKKKTSQSELSRLLNIAKEMVEDLYHFTPADDEKGQKEYQECEERFNKAVDYYRSQAG